MILLDTVKSLSCHQNIMILKTGSVKKSEKGVITGYLVQPGRTSGRTSDFINNLLIILIFIYIYIYNNF